MRSGAALCALAFAAVAGLSCVALDPHESAVAIPLADGSAHETPSSAAMDLRKLDALVSRVAPDLDDALRARLVVALMAESGLNGYDPIFLAALVGVESRWHIGAESARGARGLLQLKPSTFAWISAREPDVGGEDLETGDDPVVDVRLAIRYFNWLERSFSSRDAALMAYNAGPRRMRQHLRAGDIPERLHAYPQKVRHEYERLLRLEEQSEHELGGVLLARVP